MRHFRSLLNIIFILVLLSGCSGSDERVVPTLLPTIGPPAPVGEPAEEGELRPFSEVEIESSELGIRFVAPENWLSRLRDETQLRLVPDPETVNEFDGSVSPAIIFRLLSAEEIAMPEEIDREDPEAILGFLIEQLTFDFEEVEGVTAVSLNNQSAATYLYEQNLPELESADLEAEEEVGGVSTRTLLAVLVADDQIISFTGSTPTEAYEQVEPIFDDILNSLELTGNPVNPTGE